MNANVSAFPLLPLLLLVPVPAAQRAQASSAPDAPTGPSFIGVRYLAELESSPDNAGVMARGDLDLDGDLDIVGCERPSMAVEPTGILTWLNDGRGRFQLAHRVGIAPSGPYVALLVELADFTGDGVLDLAYDRRDRFSSPGVMVHAGLGDGSFGSGLRLVTNGPPQEFLAGDCDGDGDADLLVHENNTSTDGRNTLAWWRLEGDSFVEGSTLDVDAETPLRLVKMDVGSDGIMDAVSGTFSGYDELQIFLTVSGTPTRLTTVPLLAELRNINQRQQSGDIDGDGSMDVLLDLEDFGTDNFFVQVVLCTGSSYAALPVQVFPNPTFVHPYTRDAVLADWDGDGDLDLVSPTFSWLENTGGGHFEPAGEITSGFSGNGNRSPLCVFDADGDGDLDGLAHRLYFEGDGTFTARSSVTSQTTGLGTVNRVEDWEGDGDLDVVAFNRLDLNDGDGTFQTRYTYFFVPDAADVRVAGWDDFDGDGLRDVVASSFTYPPLEFDRMWLFAGTESGQYVVTATIPAPVEIPESTVSGDLDGDGDADILGTSGYWPNDGSAHFGSAAVVAYYGVPKLAQDLDGDQDLDLLVWRGPRREVLWNLGGLAFTIADIGAHAADERYQALDLDQDGDRDLVVVDVTNDEIEVHEVLAGGGFAVPQLLTADGTNGAVGTIDVDGDGKLDLVAAREGSINISSARFLTAWIRGDGLDFVARREWATNDLARMFGDFDGDGDGDALGQYVFRNVRFDGPGAGRALQYGLADGTPGTGGFHPVLGTGGPARPGQPLELSIARGRGQASGVLLSGYRRTDVLDGGIRRLVDPAHMAADFQLDGPAGAAGRGRTLVRLPVRASLVGRTFTFQAVVIDPGASSGLSATNGLEIHFGDWLPR